MTKQTRQQDEIRADLDAIGYYIPKSKVSDLAFKHDASWDLVYGMANNATTHEVCE